jgi:large subunit ribosomal protein L10
MSKVIKQMEMDTLSSTFKGVRDMVVLSIKGLSGTQTTAFRAILRKSKVKMHIVKNSLARKVFSEMGLNINPDSQYWIGPTALAIGGDSVAGLSKVIDGELKGKKTAPLYKEKVVVKGAVADGQEVTFEAALKMPTRDEARARIIGLALAPASRLLSQLTGPASSLSSQIKKISEREPVVAEAAPAAEPAPQPA